MNDTHSPYGHAFSPEVIAATPLPVVHPSLLPWLRKERVAAVEGSTYWNGKEDTHDRMGLTYAQRELRRIESDLADAKDDRAAILAIQQTQQRIFVQFWEGKMALLDRIIAATEGTPLP